MRLLGLLALFFAFAFGALVAGGSTRAAAPGESWRAIGVNAFEADDDRREAQTPLAPTDVDDDDDDDGDQEAFPAPSHVAPWRWPLALHVTPRSETIRPSLGHPRGIDDPPRS